MNTHSVFLPSAKSHGVVPDKAALERFSIYADMLIAKNSVMNLTSVDDPEGIYLRHFADSLALYSFLPDTPFAAIDVGCGAGFPGLPLKIIRPDMRLILLDSTGKKVDFLREVTAALSLKGVEFVNARAEDAARQHMRLTVCMEMYNNKNQNTLRRLHSRSRQYSAPSARLPQT